MSHGIVAGSSPGQNRLLARPRTAWGPLVAGAASATVLCVAWRAREDYWIAPDAGLGYALGPLGLGAMVLLLAYSIRKRAPWLRRAGAVRTWFHVHMMLGMLGPTAILLHANFEPGSLNSQVALACMLAVAGSGLIGRFIYTRIHYEYFGRKAEWAELRRDATEGRSSLGTWISRSPELAETIAAHERSALSAPTGPIESIRRTASARRSAFRVRRVARQAMRRAGRGRGGEKRDLEKELRRYLKATRRVSDYAVFERAFALWHAVHLPLCVLLFAAAAAHVVAVHRY